MKIVQPDTLRQIFTEICKNPELGSRKISDNIGKVVGRTAINNYRNTALSLGLSPADVITMSDDQICNKFGLGHKKAEFKEPDWQEVFSYLTSPRKWGHQTNTQFDAWRYLYVEKYWPDYELSEGRLPEGCMSERTFNRRYVEFLAENGLAFVKHEQNSDLRFGPGSLMEIDTIGDKFNYIRVGQNGEEEAKSAIIFTAVSKFSGKIFAKFIPQSAGPCWAQAIVDAFWYFGGLFQAVRMDNDSAICIHRGKGKSILRPSVRVLFDELEVTPDLCPPRKPRWKAGVERANGLIEQKLFGDPNKYELPLHVKNLDELNALLLQELDRINKTPRKDSTLSRQELFEHYEEKELGDLPSFKPLIRFLSNARVNQGGWVYYLKNYYYAGAANAGKEVLLENHMGLRLQIMHERNYQEIASYEIDHVRHEKASYYKDPRFIDERSAVQLRQEEWFVEQFNALPGEHEHILQLIRVIWAKLSKAAPVATRQCNIIWSLYEKNPDDLDALDAACAFLLENGAYNDFKPNMKGTFEQLQQTKLRMGKEAVLRAAGILSSPEDNKDKSEEGTDNEESAGALLHGADYYEKFTK